MNFVKIGLFAFVGMSLMLFQCASQRSSSSSVTEEDEQFRQELLSMLEDAEETPGSADSQDDVADDGILSILNDDTQQVETSMSSETEETASSAESDDWWSETDDIWASAEQEDTTTSTPQDTWEFTQPESEFSGYAEGADTGDLPTTLNRMEKSLNSKTRKLDSLRQVLENRGERLDQLENKIRSAKSGDISSQSTASPSAFQSAYQQARRQFENKNYNSCIQSMQSILEKYPSASMADNCQYWIAESYFGLGQYEKAVIEFQKVFAYEPTDKHDDAQLMIALAYKRMGQNQQAQQAFQSFLDMYPESEYVELVRKYMNM